MDSAREAAVFVGSLRNDSIGLGRAKALAELARSALKPERVEIRHLPLYSGPGTGVWPMVARFDRTLAESDDRDSHRPFDNWSGAGSWRLTLP